MFFVIITTTVRHWVCSTGAQIVIIVLPFYVTFHICAATSHNMFHVSSSQIHSHQQIIYRSLCSINLVSMFIMFTLILSFIEPSSLYLIYLLIMNFMLVVFVPNDHSCKFCVFKTFIIFCNAWCTVFRFL